MQALPRHLKPAFDAAQLQRVFADCFQDDYQTRLVGGAEEPYYRPASAMGEEHCLYFRADYFASALHEVAHWCIAGQARRQLPDFGYWYAPEGRDTRQQQAFEAVEDKPQALEWLFSLACGYRFRLSLDNLDPESGRLPDPEPFARAVLARARCWRDSGLPPRAARFFDALSVEFGSHLQLRDLELRLESLL